jgi:nucleotide sugar dehydrogenase
MTIEPNQDNNTPIEINRNGDIVLCIVGVGYVGEHLLKAFGSVFNAIGYDVSQSRLDFITPDFRSLKNVELTSDVTQLARGTHFLISVPTNLHKDNSVNTTHLVTAISTVTTYARPGSVVVIESSVSVGMTRSFLTQYNNTLFCGMSPERVDPGRSSPSLVEIPKIISALNPESMAKIYQVYSQVFQKIVPVSRPEVAEMTKLYENCYRMINIAYVNEISDACEKHKIDPNEVIDAASTKPFGFQAFRPGLGIGGHCIPINPYYLLANNVLPILEYATSQMSQRPARLAREIFDVYAPMSSSKGGLSILITGVAFKPGQSVVSSSPGLSFGTAMHDFGCKRLDYYDPLVPQSSVSFIPKLCEVNFTSRYIDRHFDVVIVCMKQQNVDFQVLDELQTTFVKYF